MAKKENRMAEEKKVEGVSRRDFIKAAGTGVVAAGLGANIIITRRACAGSKKLKIHATESWIPAFDQCQ